MAKRLRYKVREIAEAKGLGIEQLARKADLGRTTVSLIWHNQTQNVTMAVLAKLAAALGANVSDLYEEVEDTTP